MTKPQKYREVVKFLRRHGWELKRQRGSHEIWGPADGSQIVALVQHKGQVSPGVVRQIQAVFPDAPENWD